MRGEPGRRHGSLLMRSTESCVKEAAIGFVLVTAKQPIGISAGATIPSGRGHETFPKGSSSEKVREEKKRRKRRKKQKQEEEGESPPIVKNKPKQTTTKKKQVKKHLQVWTFIV